MKPLLLSALSAFALFGSLSLTSIGSIKATRIRVD